MSLIMEAWRERGYAPPGGERMLQEYEDKLELERNKQDLIYALKCPPAPPPPSPSPEDIRNEVYARIYPPSNGSAPEPHLEDLSDGTLGVAGDVHAIRRVLDASGVEHYLPFRHNSIVIGLPDVAKARNALAGARWGGDAEAKADEERGFAGGAAGSGATGRTEPADRNQGWAARPATGAAAYTPPSAASSQAAQATRPMWPDHIAGIDTPTLEAILAWRYAMREHGDDVNGPSANPRTNALLQPAFLRDNRQESATSVDPYAPMVRNLSSKVANAGGGRGFVNPPEASTHGSVALGGRSPSGSGTADVTVHPPRDAFGQPYGAPSNYDAPSQFGRIWKSDQALKDKLGQTWDWLNYTVPDASQKAAEINARQAPDPKFARIDNRIASPTGSAAALIAHALGADLDVQDNLVSAGGVLEGIGSAWLGPKTATAGRSVPQGVSPEKFEKFSSALKGLMQAENLPPGRTVVQGSRAAGTARPGESDIDVLHIVSQADFDALVAQRVPQLEPGQVADFLRMANKQQRINLRGVSLTMGPRMWDDVYYPTLTSDVKKIQFSVVSPESSFINGPLIPVR